ncbi:hypothetical protein T11_15172 [Trichinella zimbabwensis]|uniref:Uncharacterized protein n=1 Tax=Trichinella zimbabwensis TaxID=268475 RepID=A0A0V1HC26_9BILA|nr:hypothetical protein T11_15172 [Trichinella zimbabwensis]
MYENASNEPKAEELGLKLKYVMALLFLQLVLVPAVFRTLKFGMADQMEAFFEYCKREWQSAAIMSLCDVINEWLYGKFAPLHLQMCTKALAGPVSPYLSPLRTERS